MQELNVNEVFYSIQGEGYRAGCPTVFVRLMGCDQTCGFCDTEFTSGRALALQDIHDTARAAMGLRQSDSADGAWLTWTGGEPMLQLTRDIADYFRKLGWKQAVETNGAHPVPRGVFDWVACSPKVAEHVLAKNLPDGVDELRYVRHAGHQSIPSPSIKAQVFYLSPAFDGNRPVAANVARCVELVKTFPGWRLSVQSHKLLGVL